MSLSREAKDIRQRVNIKEKVITDLVTVSDSVYIVDFGVPAQKLTVQGSGTLTFTIHISVNGSDFDSSAVITTSSAKEIASYSTNIVSSIKVTRIAGEGRVTILAV